MRDTAYHIRTGFFIGGVLLHFLTEMALHRVEAFTYRLEFVIDFVSDHLIVISGVYPAGCRLQLIKRPGDLPDNACSQDPAEKKYAYYRQQQDENDQQNEFPEYGFVQAPEIIRVLCLSGVYLISAPAMSSSFTGRSGR